MGSTCCCLRDDFDDTPNPASAICSNCSCLDFITQNVFHMYTSLFRRDHAVPSSQRVVVASDDSSLEDMFHSPPRPLPYDADPVYYRIHGLVSRRDKGSSHSNEESETREESESFVPKNKWGENKSFEEIDPKSSAKLSASKPAVGFAHIYTFSEDEDVCPTCLEEYTLEDPKIVTKCSHHFHLGCIYEWMERSDNCPVCGKVMAFNETP